MLEIELKYQVPTERWRAMDAAVAGRTGTPMQRLQAAYFDLPDRALAEARLALRIRREGRHWVQTLKGLGDDGMARLEHNVSLAAPGKAWPTVDPGRHAGTEVGDRLLAVLAAQADARLEPQYRTDVRRRQRLVRTRHAVLELALDRGHILAGDRRLEIRELEIELKSGSLAGLIDTARRWQARFGLWLDLRSKAERGDLLARGLSMSPARAAALPVLRADSGVGEARRLVLVCCADQILANASQIASGQHEPEHLHQLRVGLRRLRSGLALFEPTLAATDLAAGAAEVFGRLGAARDRDVLSGELGAALQSAMGDLWHAAGPREVGQHQDTTAVEVVRSAPAQRFWLDLLAASSAEDPHGQFTSPGAWPLPAEPGKGLRRTLTRRLARWHRSASADAIRFEQLGEEDQHRLRKHLKRLRYGIEFASALLPARKTQRMLRRLQAALQRLGELNDIAMAQVHYRVSAGTSGHDWFALGWLAAQRVTVTRRARIALERYAHTEPCWRRRAAGKRK